MPSFEEHTRLRDEPVPAPWLVRYYVIDGPGTRERLSPYCRTEQEAGEHLRTLRDRHPQAHVVAAYFSPRSFREDERGQLVRTDRPTIPHWAESPRRQDTRRNEKGAGGCHLPLVR